MRPPSLDPHRSRQSWRDLGLIVCGYVIMGALLVPISFALLLANHYIFD
jgi:hypothetical protein